MVTDKMKVLVTGAKGQLGSEIVVEAARRGHNVVGVDKDELDITDKENVEKVLAKIAPDCVIHCAGWTAVDAAEDNERAVTDINVNGTEYIAKACKDIDAKMIYISTDYVFNGHGEAPHSADSVDFKPQNVYGKTKLEGEKVVARILDKYYIVRIAWLFGVHGKNFVTTMLKLADTHDSLRVVSDQIGTPTYAADLAEVLVDMAEADKYGYYNVTNEGGFISWAEFAQEIFKQAKRKTKVVPVTTKEYGMSKAVRPHNSRLDKSKLTENGFKRLPTWQDALSRYLKEIGSNGTN